MLTEDQTKKKKKKQQHVFDGGILGTMPDCNSDMEEILQDRETFDGLLKVRNNHTTSIKFSPVMTKP